MGISVIDNSSHRIEVAHLGFSGGERHVQLPELSGSVFTIRAELHCSDDAFDLLLTHNAVVHGAPGATINVEIPYLPYARQDRVCAPGQAFSLEVFARLIQPFRDHGSVAVWDCHSAVGLDLTGAYNVDASEIVLSHEPLRALINEEHTVLVCPDKGARRRCEAMARALGDRPLVYCEKVRDPLTGRILGTRVDVDDLSGKTAVITDDICDGGMTFIKIAEELLAKRADRVILFVTHGILSNGLDVFNGLIDHIYTTNSFVHSPDARLTTINFVHSFASPNETKGR
jgi:ribose-phosphate pyrophosphokinase